MFLAGYLSIFLSRFNEWWKNKYVFSFGIVAEKFGVIENDILDCKVLCIVGKGGWNSVGFVVL